MNRSAIKIYVPYTALQPLTKWLLFSYDYTPVKVDDNLGYTNYLQDRWLEREDFINIEHDIAFWPGALESLWNCPAEWCVYGYAKDDDVSEHSTPYLGCVKFTKRLMDKLPDVWERQKTEANGWRDVNIPTWSYCDAWLWERAKEKKITPHQHSPSVINANPSLIASI